MRSKIIILAIFIFLVSLLITLNVIFHESLRDELAIQYNKQQLLIAKTIADSINNTFTHLVAATTSLATALADKGIYEDEGLKTFLVSSFEKAEFDIDIIFTVFNKSGEIVFTSGKDTILPEDFSNLLQLNEKLPEGGVYYLENMMKDDMKLRITTPIRKGGKNLGLILSTVNINTLNEKILSPIKSGEHGYAWMMDSSGTLIFHPTQPGMVGNSLYK